MSHVPTTETKTIRVAIYLRISLDRNKDNLAVDRQRNACYQIAQQRGWTIGPVYVDSSKSAFLRSVSRPDYDRMVAAYHRGEFDAIVCYDLDRLTRQPRQLEDWIEWAEFKGLLLVTANGEADLSNDNGRMFARIKAAVARAEIERKSARQKSANVQRANNGTPMPGGPRTPGYEVGLAAIRPSEAELIRQGFSTLLAGGSLRSIARSWNSAGMTTAHGGQWDSTSTRTALRNPRYAALSAYRARSSSRELVTGGQWDAIVTEDVWRAAQVLLDDPARRTTPSTARLYLLSGLARCHCGGGILTGGTQAGQRTYRCAVRPGHMSKAAAPIDEYVQKLITERLQRPDAADLLLSEDETRPDVPALRDEAASLRVKLDELADLHLDGKITAAQLVRSTERATRRLDEITALTADSRRLAVLGPVLAALSPAVKGERKKFEQLDLDIRRSVIGELVTIVLHPSGRGARAFKPETVEIAWK